MIKRLLFIAALLWALPAWAAQNVFITTNSGTTQQFIRFLTSDSGTLNPEQIVTCSTGCFSALTGIALDASNNIWLADPGNSALYKFANAANGSTAPLVTISGANTALGTGPESLAFDSSGNLWVTQNSSTSNAVLEFSAAQLVSGGNIVPTANNTMSGSSGFLRGIAFDTSNNCYLGTTSSSAIMEYAAGSCGSGIPNWIITGASTTLATPVQVATDASGNIYASSTNGILKWNAGTCTHATSPCNIAPNLSVTSQGAMKAMGLDAAGNIYGAPNNPLSSFTSTGTFISAATATTGPNWGFWINLAVQPLAATPTPGTLQKGPALAKGPTSSQ